MSFKITQRNHEPLLAVNQNRRVQLLILFPEIWKAHKGHEASFWTVADIDLSSDFEDSSIVAEEG